MNLDSDPLPIIWGLMMVLLLVFMNAFFVAAEFSMVKVRSSRIETLIQEGNKRAKFARTLTNNLDAYLSACQLGITLASLGLGWIGEKTVAELLHAPLSALGASEALITTISTTIAFAFITIMHIVFGELAPKTIAIRRAEQVTLWTAIPLTVFHKIMYPFIWLLNGAANKMVGLLRVKPISEHDSAHTEDEIRILMKESNEHGLIDNTEMTLMDNVFEFADTHAHEIMIPRTEMVCIYTTDTFDQNRQVAYNEMHTRYPLCDPDKDHIIGFVHIKDLVKATDDVQDIRTLVRPILSVPESMPISALLKLLQKNKMQIAILIDEYGGTAGLVTLEDIMEEIVGDIQDEFDHDLPRIVKREENIYSLDGKMLIEEVNAYFGIDIASDDFDTIGGWVYAQVELPPKKGQRVQYEDKLDIIVEDTYHLRITRLIVKRIENQQAQTESYTERNARIETESLSSANEAS